ncbi:MAG: hypothetical protein KZQ64_02265 [gamma proteobacterium symbiont of Bathyaustriella thionipta]|nr:hypothetical protein [gamma proteobacterium symbiont of Bathyaustriella thionipta]MCU7949013.1 hypothetical protein [gamma proteobacterium symbiont of Bathyaustriella thionipta]MCU7952213.1 hypothetical protein [gamma proteobacterium symbiont of Bathyaustriella thionipta]MCU7955597.1 hypothetical protein [gamma proteobacterium symbiont of Bathyaustriella thionipta]MCU7967161.1 hypothetical protein [gamma proteobacterium symbiont of Bathyaustriella thionipta]
MNKILDTILNGLSAQYAGEYLSSSHKDQTLNNRPLKDRLIVQSPQSKVILPDALTNDKRHIAMLCNDTTNRNVLNYVLGNANDCSVDILYHGAHKIIPTESFYKQARSSFTDNNVDVSIVKLINDSIDDVKEYLLKHRTLQYLVTDSHDQLMSTFLSNKSITKHLQIPIVLIN